MNEKEIRDTIEIAQMGIAQKETVNKAIDEVRVYLGELYEQREKLSSKMNSLKDQLNNMSVTSGKKAFDFGTLQTEVSQCEEDLAQILIQISMYEEFEHNLQDSLQQFKNFNKKRCIDNIKALIKENPDAKIGMIEKEAGVSLGYLSRLDKDDNKSDPSIEFIMAAAKILKVSIDALLNFDFANISSTQQYYIGFLEKLKEQTETQQLDWGRESKGELNRLEEGDDHPLFSYEEYYREGEMGYPEPVEGYVFVSNTFNCNTYICDDCYFLRMKDNSILYLMSISKDVHRTNDQTAYAKEMWMYKPATDAQFILDNRGDKEIASLVDTLYDQIKEYMKHPIVNKDVKSVIDAFMNGDWGQNDDKLPF